MQGPRAMPAAPTVQQCLLTDRFDCRALEAGAYAQPVELLAPVESTSSEGREDSLMGLAGELAVAGLAEWCPWPRSSHRQQLVQS